MPSLRPSDRSQACSAALCRSCRSSDRKIGSPLSFVSCCIFQTIRMLRSASLSISGAMATIPSKSTRKPLRLDHALVATRRAAVHQRLIGRLSVICTDDGFADQGGHMRGPIPKIHLGLNIVSSPEREPRWPPCAPCPGCDTRISACAAARCRKNRYISPPQPPSPTSNSFPIPVRCRQSDLRSEPAASHDALNATIGGSGPHVASITATSRTWWGASSTCGKIRGSDVRTRLTPGCTLADGVA